jgi:hypothetical protein
LDGHGLDKLFLLRQPFIAKEGGRKSSNFEMQTWQSIDDDLRSAGYEPFEPASFDDAALRYVPDVNRKSGGGLPDISADVEKFYETVDGINMQLARAMLNDQKYLEANPSKLDGLLVRYLRFAVVDRRLLLHPLRNRQALRCRNLSTGQARTDGR